MAAPRINVLPPEKFWVATGEEPPLRWTLWVKQFNAYITMTDDCQTTGNKLSDYQKNNLFIMALGTEGIKQFDALPMSAHLYTASHEDILKAAGELFARPLNKIRAHFEFHECKQEHDESVNQFLLRLRTLASDCEFHGHLDYHLAIQLVYGCRKKEIQERLLAEKTVDLDNFLSLAEAVEVSKKDSNRIRGEEQVAAAQSPTGISSRNNQVRREPQNLRTGTSPQTSHNAQTQVAQCTACGFKGHKFPQDRDKCPARDQACRFCNRKGHFEKCCRKKARSRLKCIHTPAKGPQRFQATVYFKRTNGTDIPITADVDSGSDITGITAAEYKRHFSDIPLSRYNGSVTNFDHSEINGVMSKFVTMINFQGRDAEIEVLVLPDRYGQVFGNNLIAALGLMLDGEQRKVYVKERIQVVTDEFDEKEIAVSYPNLVKQDMGLIPNAKHTIMLDPEAIPVAAKLRAIPVYRREKALEQIDLMEMQGIWSKVERSKWVHPLVAVDKADGSVRITTDLSKLNDHVIPYQFPLPHIQDVYLKLSKATTFTKLDLRMGYFNLELDENSRLLTTTITPKGLYAYNRLPMGLRDAGAVFQAKVAETLKDCPQCVSYMDCRLRQNPTRA